MPHTEQRIVFVTATGETAADSSASAAPAGRTKPDSNEASNASLRNFDKKSDKNLFSVILILLIA
jgi:hypothetical protein